MPSPAEEIILAFPSPVVPARHARSTVLLGSIAAVREAGRFDDYVARLPLAYRDMLLEAVAGAWLPIEAAVAHYEACELLGFSLDQQAANGRATFDKTRGMLMGTMARMARESGVTPWSVMPYYQRFWERGYDGGGMCITKLGPKEARLDIVQLPPADCRYFRNALRGLATAVLEPFCAKGYVTERPGKRAPASVSYRYQWA